MLSSKQVQEFKARLEARERELAEEIRQEMLETEDESYADLAGQVHDREDESVADLLVDVDLTIVEIHMDELRAIATALKRIAAGEYGICADCSEDISLDRLRANPMAVRCHSCQERHERQQAGRGTPTL